jgi:hypothetical protein
MAHVEVDFPIGRRDEFERAIVDIIAGERPRIDELDRGLVGSASPVVLHPKSRYSWLGR